jgi:hypothetical protein
MRVKSRAQALALLQIGTKRAALMITIDAGRARNAQKPGTTYGLCHGPSLSSRAEASSMPGVLGGVTRGMAWLSARRCELLRRCASLLLAQSRQGRSPIMGRLPSEGQLTSFAAVIAVMERSEHDPELPSSSMRERTTFRSITTRLQIRLGALLKRRSRARSSSGMPGNCEAHCLHVRLSA